MLTFNEERRRYFRRLLRKSEVCATILKQRRKTLARFLKFAGRPHLALKQETFRRQTRIFLVYRPRLLLERNPNLHRLHECVKQWSPGVVKWFRRTVGVQEHVEEVIFDKKKHLSSDEVSRQLKEQLALLKSGKRNTTLIEPHAKEEKKHLSQANGGDSLENRNLLCNGKSINNAKCPPNPDGQSIISSLQKGKENLNDVNLNDSKDFLSISQFKPTGVVEENEKVSPKCNEKDSQVTTGRENNFLDKLINKVGGKIISNRLISEKSQYVPDTIKEATKNQNAFAGNTPLLPGMLMTPIVPETHGTGKDVNPVFISESLNEYMRQNSLGADPKDDNEVIVKHRQYKPMELEGLVHEKSLPPPLEMPAIPANLLKSRTVAERKQYLQRLPRNPRMAIINNEATIYRELQRKGRLHKNKSSSQLQAQSLNSPMSFTRNGWRAASFINTQYGKYYYQMIECSDGQETVSARLRGVCSNNDHFRKKPHVSIVRRLSANSSKRDCPLNCVDKANFDYLKPIHSLLANDDNRYRIQNKSSYGKLQRYQKPCPLLYKPFQRPLDDDLTALHLVGNTMALVRMPRIELQLFPKSGKSFNEMVKRYLQYIMPYQNITKEWARFSVSTLETEFFPGAGLLDKNNEKSLVPFNFVIPYQNDCDRVLVRRIVRRSEKLDDLFQKDGSIKDHLKEFSFRQNIDMEDQELVECADILSEMIISVAISCSENSFTKEDPDVMKDANNANINVDDRVDRESSNSNKNILPPSNEIRSSALCTYSRTGFLNRKPNRLLMELKRLNATVIHAAATEKDQDISQPCLKETCSLGCVCQSLSAKAISRDHCGKAKCVIECLCKKTSASHIISLQSSEKSISDEDALMLRRKATARLARMEKDFNSTIVLTGKEALLINEANQAKKRRSTKLPKRFDDFDEHSDTEIAPSKRRNLGTSNGGEAQQEAEKDIGRNNQSHKPVTHVRKDIFDNLKHCSVNLVRLKDTENIVPWCMVHNLYKCFCKGKAIDGEPFVIESDQQKNLYSVDGKTASNLIKKGNAESVSTTSKDNGDLMVINSAKISSYSYKSKKKMNTEKINDNAITSKAILTRARRKSTRVKYTETVAKDDLQQVAKEQYPIEKEYHVNNSVVSRDGCHQKRLRTPEEIKSFYFCAKPELSRRHIPVPRRLYIQLNRARRQDVFKFIERTENQRSKLLMKVRIANSMNSVPLTEQSTFSPAATIDQNEITDKLIEKLLGINQPSLPTRPKADSPLMLGKVINLVDDDEVDQEKDKSANADVENIAHSSGVNPAFSASDNVKRGHYKSDFMRKMPSLCGEPDPSSTFSGAATENCIPPNYKSLLPMPSSNVVAQKTMQALAAEINMTHEEFRVLYGDVIRSMNSLVCKRMYDVSDAFKCDGISLPPPQNGILCIMRWANFLTAYNQKYLYVWQVKMKDQRCCLVITVNNMMPMIMGAVGVANITALKVDRLPLMARLLVKNYSETDSHNLGVIMLGRNRSWLVKGFIRGEAKYACFKPNPTSRPDLTKKINIFCCLLLRKRINEEKAKLQAQRAAPTAGETDTFTITNISTNDELPQINNNAAVALSNNTIDEVQSISAVPSMGSRENSVVVETDKIKVVPLEVPSVSTNGMKVENSGLSVKEMKSNLMIRKVKVNDLKDLIFPDIYIRDHKWMVIDIRNDFSHIFVPDFHELLSIDRIQKVMKHSKAINKIIKMQFFPKAPFDLFVSPASQSKLLVGPLSVKMEQPVLLLLQSVDGKMLMREVYHSLHNIQQTAENTTTAFWLLCMGGQIHLDFGLTPNDCQAKAQANVDESKSVNCSSQATDGTLIKVENASSNPILYALQQIPPQAAASAQNATIAMPPALITLPLAINQSSVFQTMTSGPDKDVIPPGATQVSNVTLAQPLLLLVAGNSTAATTTSANNNETSPQTSFNTNHQNFIPLNIKTANNIGGMRSKDIVTISATPTNGATISSTLGTLGFNASEESSPPKKLKHGPPSLIPIKAEPTITMNTPHLNSRLNQIVLSTSSSSLNSIIKSPSSASSSGTATLGPPASSSVIYSNLIATGDVKLANVASGAMPIFTESTSSSAIIGTQKQALSTKGVISTNIQSGRKPSDKAAVVCNSGRRTSTPLLMVPGIMGWNNTMLLTNNPNTPVSARNKRAYSVLEGMGSTRSPQSGHIQSKLENGGQKIQKPINVANTHGNQIASNCRTPRPSTNVASTHGNRIASNCRTPRQVTNLFSLGGEPAKSQRAATSATQHLTTTTAMPAKVETINEKPLGIKLENTIDGNISLFPSTNLDNPRNPSTTSTHTFENGTTEDVNVYRSNAVKSVGPILAASGSLSSNFESFVPPSHIQYGYLVSKTLGQRFVSKRINNHYFVKFSGEGIVRFDSIERVALFLNRYLARNNHLRSKLPAQWFFVPASKGIQLQNYKKSLIRRRRMQQQENGVQSENGNDQTNQQETILIDD